LPSSIVVQAAKSSSRDYAEKSKTDITIAGKHYQAGKGEVMINSNEMHGIRAIYGVVTWLNKFLFLRKRVI
jgi:hypothetical protein